MKSWINKQQKTSQNTKICYICKAELEDKHANIKNIEVLSIAHAI